MWSAARPVGGEYPGGEGRSAAEFRSGGWSRDLAGRFLGPHHRDILMFRNNLACAYQAAGRTGEAIALHERTPADQERVLVPDHRDTLGVLRQPCRGLQSRRADRRRRSYGS